MNVIQDWLACLLFEHRESILGKRALRRAFAEICPDAQAHKRPQERIGISRCGTLCLILRRPAVALQDPLVGIFDWRFFLMGAKHKAGDIFAESSFPYGSINV